MSLSRWYLKASIPAGIIAAFSMWIWSSAIGGDVVADVIGGFLGAFVAFISLALAEKIL